MQYADELVREYLVFRGFTTSLQTFEKELGTDIGKGFQVDKILDLIFSIYVPKFQADNLISLLNFFKQCFSSSETVRTATLLKLEVSILRYYIVHCLQCGRSDKVVDFLGVYGNDLLQRNQDWASWFSGFYLLVLILFMLFLYTGYLGFRCFLQPSPMSKTQAWIPSSAYTFQRSGSMPCNFPSGIFWARCLMAPISFEQIHAYIFPFVVISMLDLVSCCFHFSVDKTGYVMS